MGRLHHFLDAFKADILLSDGALHAPGYSSSHFLRGCKDIKVFCNAKKTPTEVGFFLFHRTEIPEFELDCREFSVAAGDGLTRFGTGEFLAGTDVFQGKRKISRIGI